MLLSVLLAHGHGSRFGLSDLSVAPEAPAAIWGVSTGWGVIHTGDGGESWTWHCEEALGVSAVYDVLALDADRAWLATSGGLFEVDTGCGVTRVPGLPEDGYPAALQRAGAEILVAAYAEERNGLWRCTESGCAEGPVGGADLYVKSMVVDGDTWWVSTVTAGSLAADLRRVRDGSVEVVARWPDGAVDPRVYRATGDVLLVWLQSRSETSAPALARSEDGGYSFELALEHGLYTDPLPGLMCVGESCYLGSDAGRTWFSPDGGEDWAEVTDAAPAVRCSDASGDGVVFCADHYADGFDAGWWVPDRPVRGIGCLDEALPPACADTCDPLVPTFQEAGLYGGDACRPAPAAPAEPAGCGRGGAAFAPLAFMGVLRAGRWKRGRR